MIKQQRQEYIPRSRQVSSEAETRRGVESRSLGLPLFSPSLLANIFLVVLNLYLQRLFLKKTG